jgi:leucyl/phenylalanyl-tRNA---protein transferase
VPRDHSPVWLPPSGPCVFPDPRAFSREGLIAGGGDLSAERLLLAYRSGLFPWYNKPPILWWSPDPRAIISPESLHVSRSLKRRINQGTYRVTYNRAPEAVLDGCADREEGTWLNTEMKAAYLRLFDLGHLVSFEVWDNESPSSESVDPKHLVGGLYGVLVDGLFAAESKFHRKVDASKVALVCAVSTLFSYGVTLFDVQFVTDHLSTLGVHNMSRLEYLTRLVAARSQQVHLPLAPADLCPDLRRKLRLHSAACTPQPEIDSAEGPNWPHMAKNS